MNAIANNSELIVFGVSVVPIMTLVFRFLLKLQVSGEDIYERRAHTQSATIEEQDRLIRQLQELKYACEKRDREARNLIESLTSEIDTLKKQVVELQINSHEK